MRPVLALILLFIFSQSLYILNGHPYWDALIYDYFASIGDRDGFITPWVENGRPVIGFLYWVLASFLGLKGGFQSVVAVQLLVSSVLVERILRHASWMTFEGRLLAAATMLVFPAIHVHASFTTAVFALFTPALLLSIYTYLVYIESERTARSSAIYLLSLLCSFVALFSEGLIVSCFLIPIIARAITSGEHTRPSGQSWKSDAPFYLVAVGFVAIMKVLMPVSGAYATSRNLSSSSEEILQFFFDFTTTLASSTVAKVSLWQALTAIALTGLLTSRHLIRKDPRTLHRGKMLLLALAYFVAASAPFAIATRVPGSEGWNARHFTALLFPIALLLGSWLSFWVSNLRLARLLGTMLVFGLLLTLWKYQLAWEARSAFEQGLIVKLRETELNNAGRIVIAPPVPSVLSEIYRVYEWNILLNQVTGNFDRLLVGSENALENWSLDPAFEVQKTHKLIGNGWEAKRDCIAYLEIQNARALSWKDGGSFLFARLAQQQNLDWTRELSRFELKFVDSCPTHALR